MRARELDEFAGVGIILSCERGVLLSDSLGSGGCGGCSPLARCLASVSVCATDLLSPGSL